MKNIQNITNILTFDLEEWFHILDLPQPVGKSEWDRMPSHAEKGLDLFLDILSRNNITCTFFVLGWVADKHPDFVRKLNSLNHEIASHGYFHEMISNLNPDLFRKDIRRSKKTLEDLSGKEIKGYRGPGFSITSKNQWALDIIAEEGFQYDATLYPGHHGHGGIPGLPIRPFIIQTENDHRIEEYPVTLINIANYRFAFSGGGYFRLFPKVIISQYIKMLNRKGIPVLSYLHPRDMDYKAPQLPMPRIRRFKCYINVSGSVKKLDKLLQKHSFGSIENWRKSNKDTLKVYNLGKNSWA